MSSKRQLCAAAALLCAATWASAQTTPATMAPLNPEQQRFYKIYKELVEINTTHSVGNNTEAARAMQKHLLDAGFKPDELQIFEPFPRKGNLVASFKGRGAKKPMLRTTCVATQSWLAMPRTRCRSRPRPR